MGLIAENNLFETSWNWYHLSYSGRFARDIGCNFITTLNKIDIKMAQLYQLQQGDDHGSGH
jgi:hypothetical protein